MSLYRRLSSSRAAFTGGCDAGETGAAAPAIRDASRSLARRSSSGDVPPDVRDATRIEKNDVTAGLRLSDCRTASSGVA